MFEYIRAWRLGQRAQRGIEPGTSRTRSENHATIPNSQVMVSDSGRLREPRAAGRKLDAFYYSVD